MVRPLALLRTLIIAAFAAVLVFAPAHAQQFVTVTTTTVTWSYDDADDADDGSVIDEDSALLDDEALAGDADLGTTRAAMRLAGRSRRSAMPRQISARSR